jgi:hypothetical protein
MAYHHFPSINQVTRDIVEYLKRRGMLAVADIAARMQHAAGGDSDSVLIHLGNELHKAMIFKEFQEILKEKCSLEPLGALDFP